MKENEILAEIHRVRAEHARECNYDVDVIFAEMREELKRLQAEGWLLVCVNAAAARLPVVRSFWPPCFRTRVTAKVSSSRNAMRVASSCAVTSRSSSNVTASTETDFGAEQVKS